MPSIYKYLPSKYVDDFVRTGAVLFRSLSYFRDYEEAEVRGDEFEGTKLYRPSAGLEITNLTTQQKGLLPHAFESTANERDIFVFCASTIFSSELAAKFQASACVEITDLPRFIAGIRSALLRRPSIKSKTLVHREVKYYAPDQPPLIDWAFPDRIATSKLDRYSFQREYRIAFGTNDAFRLENTSIRLVAPGERRFPKYNSHPERLLKLGNLTRICRIHRFE